MWSCLLLTGFAFTTELPADALEPANRSEVAILMERLAVLEQQMAQQQTRINGLKFQVRELESASVERQQTPRDRSLPYPLLRRTSTKGFHFDFAFQSANGEFQRLPSEPTSVLEPQPYRTRCSFNHYFCWGHRVAPLIPDKSGRFLVTFWIAPPWLKTDPLQGGYLLGTELDDMRSPQSSFFDEIENSMCDEVSLQEFPYGKTGW